MPTTFVDQINGNPLYAARAAADEDGTNLKQYYTKRADLAPVAFSGSYNDLVNIPTIPTKTSDLTNDSGFITASDIPAQVNADWNAVSGAAQILNKPDMSLYALTSSLAAVATSGSYLDLADLPTISNVPAVTSSDGGKVLTASYADDTGSYSWQDAPTFIQEQSDWSEVDATDPAYIKNKPNFFIAQYGVTTYAEVLAAFDAGLNVLCYKPYNGTSYRSYMLGVLGFAYIDSSFALASRNFEFMYFLPLNRDNQATTSNQGIASIESWHIYGDDSWSRTSKPVAPLVAAGTGMSVSYSNTARKVTIGVTSAISTGAAAGSTAVQPSDLATVATSGSYTDLSNTPTIPDAQVQSDWSQSDSTAVDYIKNKPADAPSDNKEYVRKNGAWVESSGAVETALWSDDNGSTASSITLSESPSNFERIIVVINDQYGYGSAATINQVIRTPGESRYCYNASYTFLAGSQVYTRGCTIQATTNSATSWNVSFWTTSINTSGEATCSTSPTQIRLMKVIGVNRIASI